MPIAYEEMSAYLAQERLRAGVSMDTYLNRRFSAKRNENAKRYEKGRMLKWRISRTPAFEGSLLFEMIMRLKVKRMEALNKRERVKRIEVSHNGKRWNAAELAKMVPRTERWCRERLKEVLSKNYSMAELLERLKTLKKKTSYLYTDLEYNHKLRIDGKLHLIIITPRQLMDNLGLQREAAVKRILKANRFNWTPEKVLAPARGLRTYKDRV